MPVVCNQKNSSKLDKIYVQSLVGMFTAECISIVGSLEDDGADRIICGNEP